MFNRVSRASYSTGITQDFLANILARAQEATAKKNNEVSRSSKRRRNNFKTTSHRSAPVTPRVNPTTSPNVVNKRPQFKKRQTSLKNTPAEGVDLIDVMSGPTTSSPPTKKPVLRKSKREIPAIANTVTLKSEGRRFVPRPVVEKEYTPQEPTSLSLMKFWPDLAITPASRMINYSLDALKSSDYPLNRSPYYGFYDKAQGRAKHMAITLKGSNFGKYQPVEGSMFQKEKFLSELAVECKPFERDAKVSGKYPVLKPYSREDFKSIAKSDKKREELFVNGEIVKKSLERNPMDPEVRELVYDVCSGMKPISELCQ